MSYIPKVDKELIIKAKQNDEQAIADIINIIDRPCHKIALKYTFSNNLSYADADDLAQEAYLKVFQKLDTLDNEDGFSAWVSTVVNNTAKDYLRKKEIAHKNTQFSNLDDPEHNEIFESTLKNDYTAFEPEANVDYTVLQEGMQNCLNQLPSNEKSALYKFYFENMKISEIAEEMEANQNTIKSWLSRGKKNLEAVLVSLQKKDAAFYGVGAIPFFVWMLNKELDSSCVVKASEVAKVIVSLSKNSDVAVKTSALKAFLATSKGKALTATLAVAILAGGVGIYNILNAQPVEAQKTVQKTSKKTKASPTKTKTAEVAKEENKESSKETKTDSEDNKSEHSHDWVAQYKTVHHDAVKQTQTVVDQAAYDEPVYSTRSVTKWVCNNITYNSYEEMYAAVHVDGYADKFFFTTPQVEEQYQSGTKHHDAVTHQEQVVVQQAYDEQVLTGYKCSECGKTKK